MLNKIIKYSLDNRLMVIFLSLMLVVGGLLTVKEMEVDLVVLCQALVPRRGQAELAEVLGIELDEHGFVRVPQRLSEPVATSRPGVFACGYCQAPSDIPESVVQASGAAARVAEALA